MKTLFYIISSLMAAGSIGYLFYLACYPVVRRCLSAVWRKRVLSAIHILFLIPVGAVWHKIIPRMFAANHALKSERIISVITMPSPQGFPMQANPAPDSSNIALFQIMAMAWMLVSIGALLLKVVRYGCFLWNIKRSSQQDCNESHVACMKVVCKELKIREKRVRLATAPQIGTPLLYGLIHPVIILPQQEYSRQQLKLILHHELTHYKSRDLWMKWAGILVKALHWFNPLVYLLAIQFERWAEFACDERVALQLNKEERYLYAMSILEAASPKDIEMQGTPLAFYSLSQNMKVRITMMLHTKQKSKQMLVATGAILTIVCTTGILAGAATSGEGTLPEKQGAANKVSATEVLPDASSVNVEQPAEKLRYPVNGQHAYWGVGFGDQNGFVHTGVDFVVADGTDVYAAMDGEVTISGWTTMDGMGYGYMVEVTHPNGWKTRYAHNSELSVKAGEQVKAGQLIAYSGNTGNSTGPHLHFELLIDGIQVDPTPYFDSSDKSVWLMPLAGDRWDIGESFLSYAGHTGLDFRADTGTPIYAVSDGKIVKSGRAGAYGYCVVIDHGNGMQTLYAQCSELLVDLGEEVVAGQQIACVGTTGNSTEPHLHFEVRINSRPVDPIEYLPIAKS